MYQFLFLSVSVVAKDVDSFNKNEEQQGEIKGTLQYPMQYVQPNLTVLLLSIDFFTQCIM
jgi:hypothetical protein